MYYGVSRVSSMLLHSTEPQTSGLKKLDIIPCLMRMKNLDMLSEELNIDCDEINLEM
jgi:hypothetical protein